MGNRPTFLAKNEKPFFNEVNIDFEYFNGFALSQKQKSIESLHLAFKNQYPSYNILEVSRKSKNYIGTELSAFNLMLTNTANGLKYPVECIFQSSKVFENGGPYLDLMAMFPRDAKRDERLKTSGNLICFKYNDVEYPLIPKTLFYDWIYINALIENANISKEVLKYDAFTDIEFNPKKSINCQARAIAIYVGLNRANELEHYLSSIDNFKSLYNIEESQISLFD